MLRPRWLLWHLVLVMSSIAMVLLGRWQWHVGVRTGDLRNYAYAFQWWAFVAFAIFLWARVLRDVAHRRDPGSATARAASGMRERAAPAHPHSGEAFRAYRMPQADAIVVEDPQLAAYNAYLSSMRSSVEDA